MTMPGAVTPLTDIGVWARGSGLEIVLFVTGALLLTRFATWLGGRITAHIDALSGNSDSILRTEAAKHRHALTQVVTWSFLVLVYCLTAVLVAQRFGVPLSGFVAPATVVGVALGFGAVSHSATRPAVPVPSATRSPASPSGRHTATAAPRHSAAPSATAAPTTTGSTSSPPAATPSPTVTPTATPTLP